MYLLLIVDNYVTIFSIYWLKYCYCVDSLVFISDRLGISDDEGDNCKEGE